MLQSKKIKKIMKLKINKIKYSDMNNERRKVAKLKNNKEIRQTQCSLSNYIRM